MHLKKPLAVVATASFVVLAACSGGGNGGTSAGAPEEDFQEAGTAGEAQDPTAEAPAPPIDGAQEGGTIRVLSTLGVQTMDPTEAYFTNTSSILSGLVTRSLTQYVYRDGNMVLIPDLATDLGTPNEDFTEWTFEIREGVKWENGDPVTMDDIVFGINRSFDNFAEGAFPNGAGYSKEYFLNGDTYNGPYSSPGETCECTEVDGQNITIKMARPFPDMPYWGAFPAMGPIPAETAGEPADYALHPMATGPYMFDEYQPGSTLTLVQNDQWDPDTDPGRRQLPESYEFELDLTDEVTIDTEILSDQGQGQTTISIDDVQQSNLDQARSQDQLATGGQPCTFFEYFDMRRPKWEDMNVRKAYALAYPYVDAWLAAGYIIGVTRLPGTGILPPGIPGRPEEEPDPAGTEGENTDPEAARQLLEEAGALNTEVRFLYTSSDPSAVAVKDAKVKALKEAGFKPVPVAAADSTERSELTQDPNTDIDVRTLGWCSDWPSGLSWFPPVFSSDGSSNYSYLSVPELDQKMDDIQTLPLEEQAAAWGELDAEIMNEYLPVVNIGYSGVAMPHGSKVMGMNNDNVFGMPTWKDMWVAQ